MAVICKLGSGGGSGIGGGGLFKIFMGAEDPVNPVEGDIWVQEDIEITKFITSVDAPEASELEDGTAYIQYGEISADTMNKYLLDVLNRDETNTMMQYVKYLFFKSNGVLYNPLTFIYVSNEWKYLNGVKEDATQGVIFVRDTNRGTFTGSYASTTTYPYLAAVNNNWEEYELKEVKLSTNYMYNGGRGYILATSNSGIIAVEYWDSSNYNGIAFYDHEWNELCKIRYDTLYKLVTGSNAHSDYRDNFLLTFDNRGDFYIKALRSSQQIIFRARFGNDNSLEIVWRYTDNSSNVGTVTKLYVEPMTNTLVVTGKESGQNYVDKALFIDCETGNKIIDIGTLSDTDNEYYNNDVAIDVTDLYYTGSNYYYGWLITGHHNGNILLGSTQKYRNYSNYSNYNMTFLEITTTGEIIKKHTTKIAANICAGASGGFCLPLFFNVFDDHKLSIIGSPQSNLTQLGGSNKWAGTRINSLYEFDIDTGDFTEVGILNGFNDIDGARYLIRYIDKYGFKYVSGVECGLEDYYISIYNPRNELVNKITHGQSMVWQPLQDTHGIY